MRFLAEAAGSESPDTADALVAHARAARGAGLDGVALRPSGELPAPLVVAAAIAAAVPDILVAAQIPLGDRHPVEVAEEASVVDLASGGRLVLIARPGEGVEAGRYAEALDLLRIATAAAPFRFDGRFWQVPAGLPEHRHAPELARMTPPPARPRLELWGAGPAALEPCLARGLGHVSDEDVDGSALGAAWARSTESGGVTLGAPRGRRERWSGAEQLVRRLSAGRASFNQDWAIVAAPPQALAELGRSVRPRVQLERLPSGLEAHWRRAEELSP